MNLPYHCLVSRSWDHLGSRMNALKKTNHGGSCRASMCMHWLLWQIHPKKHAWTPAKQRMASESTMSTRTMYMKLGNAQHLDVKWLKWFFKCASNIIFTSRDAHRLVRRCQWLRISFCAGAPANPHVRHWTWRGRRSIWNFGLEHVAMRNDNTFCNTSFHLGRSWMWRICCMFSPQIDVQDLLYHSLKANKFMTS